MEKISKMKERKTFLKQEISRLRSTRKGFSQETVLFKKIKEYREELNKISKFLLTGENV